MQSLVKQVAAVDVAKDELVFCLGRMSQDLTLDLYAEKTFLNSPDGFEKLLVWVEKNTSDETPVRFVMEATGIYHESLAYFLHDHGQEVSIVLPNKISNYVRTLETKTITDQTAARAIAQFGLERKLDRWEAPTGVYRQLRQLTRERSQLIEERTVVKNQMHAEQWGAFSSKKTIDRCKKRIALLDKQEVEIRGELDELIATDSDVQRFIMLACTIPGVGRLTAVTVLGETNGFDLIRNKRQLTSYAGLDIREKQSGSSVKGKARISKRGNKYLRSAMHFPALTAIRHDERYKAVFARLVARHGIKMKAAVAIQRKLLELIYVVCKTQQPFDKHHLSRKNQLQKTT
jgi:transposase